MDEAQALAGVKILDFGQHIAGPTTSRHLANYGAQVVRIESVSRTDMTRTVRVATSPLTDPDLSPLFTQYNTSKYSMKLNLKHPRAFGVVEKLVRWADVVVENFTPGTMDRLGLGYDRLKGIKPDIILVSISGFGQTGPWRQEGAVDGIINAVSGRHDLTGWPDRGPTTPSVHPYPDVLIPLYAASAIVAALDYRQRTGKGQYIDVSMLEVCVHQITPALLEWQINKHLPARNGNRIPNAAPHGVFRCQGDDRWCAIGVFTDEEWREFRRVLGNPPWTKKAKFATLPSRKKNEDELEKLITEWTEKHSAEEVMQMMQAAGVAAGVVQDARDLLNDPQLKERGFPIRLKHPLLGVFGHPTPGYCLSKTGARIRTSPCFGEHTEFVYSQIIGGSDEEFVELVQLGVLE
jgi:benzylsuccinate CoA-transferase BbsF subunit